MILFSPKSKRDIVLFLVVIAVTGLILLAITVFYLLNPRQVIGDSLVNTPSGTPEEWPPTNISPFYVKPVTIMFAAAVVFSYCLFSLVQKPIARLPRSIRAIFLVASVLSLGVSFYEILFNFVLWGSLMVKGGDPDLIVNSYPVSSVKIDLVFATKSFVALFFASYFALECFRRSLDFENV